MTPHFHDISIENVHATGGDVAGVIVGLPESPVVGLTLKNVDISAKTGMKVAYANTVFDNVKVTAAEGEGITVSPTATVTRK